MKRCLICFEDVYEKTSLLQYFQKEDLLCGKCAAQLILYSQPLQLADMKLKACYLYNTFLESLFFQFKEGRDVALKEIFLRHFVKWMEKEYKDYTLVYMPSSYAKNEERGFFALALLYEQVKLNKVELFEKVDEIKQSKQNMVARKQIANHIRMKKNAPKIETKVLLIDDVCTSGSTLLSARTLLRNHPYEVAAFVISVHPHFIATMK